MEVLKVVLVLLPLVLVDADFTCTKKANGESYPKEVCVDTSCMGAIRNQIEEELKAAFTYMQMGVYFARDNVNRPGMAKFMFEAASEERSHAIQMLDYLTMRGSDFTLPPKSSLVQYTPTGVDDGILPALEAALEKEIDVTEKIRNIVDTCKDDFHAGDVFTNPILDEQHDGIRKLQGAIRTYKGLVNSNEKPLGRYLFDRQVLKGEVL